MTVLRQIKPPDAAIYIVAQLAGGVAGALLTKLLLEDEGRAVDYGITAVSGAHERAILPGMVVEAIGTFFLVWVIVGVAVNPRATKEWAALAIGAALGMLRDGARAAHRARASTRRAASAPRSCPASSTAPATSCSSTSSAPGDRRRGRRASPTSTSSSRRGRRAWAARSRSASRPRHEGDDRGAGDEVGEDRRVPERRDVGRAVHEVQRRDQPGERVDQQMYVRVAVAALP